MVNTSMTNSDIVVLLEEVKDYLEYIGCGETYGVLGHDAGGLLSHSVLHNDPHCRELDAQGNVVTCQLQSGDKQNITDVYNDLNEVIDRGQNQEFVDRLDVAIHHLVNQNS